MTGWLTRETFFSQGIKEKEEEWHGDDCWECYQAREEQIRRMEMSDFKKKRAALRREDEGDSDDAGYTW